MILGFGNLEFGILGFGKLEFGILGDCNNSEYWSSGYWTFWENGLFGTLEFGKTASGKGIFVKVAFGKLSDKGANGYFNNIIWQYNIR